MANTASHFPLFILFKKLVQGQRMDEAGEKRPKRCFLTTQVKVDSDDKCYKCIDKCYKCILSSAPNVLNSLSQVCMRRSEKLSLISNGN